MIYNNLIFIINNPNFYAMMVEYLNSIQSKIKHLYPNIKSDICVYNNDLEYLNKYLDEPHHDETIYIVTLIDYVGSPLLSSQLNKNMNSNLLLLNTEQNSRPNILADLLHHLNHHIVLDYSISNTIYTNHPNHRYLPYQINQHELFNYDLIYDIAMISGCIGKYKRRDRIFNSIRTRFKRKKKLISMHYISTYGNERDSILFKCKILLNIHAAPNYQIFEEIRCNRCIFNKIIVISEESTYSDNLLLKNHMILCKYDDMVDQTIDVLNNYQSYYQKLFNHLDLEQINQQFENHLKNSLDTKIN